jgi:molybdopterin synthase sulfur carrier subunit
MSSVPVLLFASYADAFGARRLPVPVRAPCTVAELVDAMRTLPGGDRLPSEPLVAVNHAWAAPNAVVHDGDEVAVIPPVAGG